jgi:hypothetical protein
MFAPWIKMAARVAALVAGVAIVVVVFNNITIPALDVSQATTYLNVAYSIGTYYIPGFQVLFNLAITLITLNITIITAKLGLLGVKWLLRVNEG